MVTVSGDDRRGHSALAWKTDHGTVIEPAESGSRGICSDDADGDLMSVIEWIACVVFLVAIVVGFIYCCRGSRDRAREPYEMRSVIEDSAGLGSGGGGPVIGS
jgi:hypothetical protein